MRQRQGEVKDRTSQQKKQKESNKRESRRNKPDARVDWLTTRYNLEKLSETFFLSRRVDSELHCNRRQQVLRSATSTMIVYKNEYAVNETSDTAVISCKARQYYF